MFKPNTYCLECGKPRTKKEEWTKGRDKKCYDRYLYRISPKRRKDMKKHLYNWIEKNQSKWKKIVYKATKKHYKKYGNEINRTRRLHRTRKQHRLKLPLLKRAEHLELARRIFYGRD